MTPVLAGRQPHVVDASHAGNVWQEYVPDRTPPSSVMMPPPMKW